MAELSKIDGKKCYKFVLYMTIGEDLEVMHSTNPDIDVYMYFEKPDSVYGFKSARINVNKILVEEREGFSDEELARLVDIVRNNKQLVMKYASVGGALYA